MRASTTGATLSGVRTVYLAATDPERSPSAQLFRAEAQRTTVPDLPGGLSQRREAVAAWAAAEREDLAGIVDGAPSAAARTEMMRRCALGCAPLALRSGAWLQWLSAPGCFDEPAVLGILSLYAEDLGVGRPRSSRGHAYLALLDKLRLAEYAAPIARLPLDARIRDAAFRLPALLLAASRHPDQFRPEILGADLLLRTVGLLPGLEPVRRAMPAEADWVTLDSGRARWDGEPDAAERAYRAAAESAEPERLAAGFAWAYAELRAWSRGLREELTDSLDPAYGMAELLRARAREGAVYHERTRIGDRTLADWLSSCRTDPYPFMAQLASSRMVRPGDAKRSPLVSGLVGERGPMFRVFSDDDLRVIARWIDALGEPGTAQAPAAREPGSPSPDLVLPAAGDRPGGTAPGGVRDAYHLLQTRSDTPALRRFAVGYIDGWLARARHGLDRGEMPLPETWQTEGLRPWLLEQHDRHGEEFQRTVDDAMPSREELVDSTVQLAPLTLIDGAWLQGFTDYDHATSTTGFSLFRTYWDELGNGDPRLNHPLIYRDVLAEMGVRLPPTGSTEFAHWDGFRDASFELPVFWLCVGRFPQTYQAEILGLNLAMELSGVGGSYRRARRALKKYGYSTYFVDIHNTIDNVATGHSAWAADAVDSYLAGVLNAEGARAQAAAWQRVRAGYRALNPPATLRARRAQRKGRRAAHSL
ncbi:iron-containing redox enzyme family protein [Actinoplanes sp. NPDC051411]|uniref:iron-containing redox enzyme family protein n=1 Tax=Actinoplanes sp. NPDC051411 TaxID=3155522 RepID=UPI003416956A